MSKSLSWAEGRQVVLSCLNQERTEESKNLLAAAAKV